jgi:hypothetical protein
MVWYDLFLLCFLSFFLLYTAFLGFLFISFFKQGHIPVGVEVARETDGIWMQAGAGTSFLDSCAGTIE